MWGTPSPTNRGPRNHLFSTTSQFNTNIWRPVSPERNMIYTIRQVRLLHCLKATWTLVHKRLKIGPLFYPPIVNSAFYCIGRLRRRRPANGTQPNFAKQWTVNRANNLPLEKSGSSLPKKIGAKNLYTFVRFFDVKTWWRISSEREVTPSTGQRCKKVRGVSYIVNFGPQTGKNRSGVFTHPPWILHSASLPGVAHGKRNPTKLYQTGEGKRRWCEPNKLAPHSKCDIRSLVSRGRKPILS